jgi:hypothetical protein
MMSSITSKHINLEFNMYMEKKKISLIRERIYLSFSNLHVQVELKFLFYKVVEDIITYVTKI